MTGEQLVNLLILRLGNRNNADIVSRIQAELQLSQETVCEEMHWYPWFLRYTNTAIIFTAEVDKITLPNNFILFDEDWGGLFVLNPALETPVKYEKLRRITLDDYWNKYVYEVPGTPRRYALDTSGGGDEDGGVELLISPVPDVDYASKVQYIGKDVPPPVTNIGNRWLKYAPDLLIAHAGYQLAAKHFLDTGRAASFKEDLAVATKRLLITNTARIEPESRTMGEPE